MNKKIIFSLLLITNTVTYGMKRERQQLPNMFLNNDLNTAMVLFNPDLLPQITTGLCSSHRYWPRKIRTDIGALSVANKFFKNYYAQEKIQQDIIQLCSQHRKLSSRDIARDLKCHAIYKTINYFTNIAKNENLQFNENDLKNQWYLNITTTIWDGYLRKNLRQSLAQVALEYSNPEKVMHIITHAQQLDFCYNNNLNPLTTIANRRSSNRFDKKLYSDLLEIARHLLEKGLLIEYREYDDVRTPLMMAVGYKDKELTKLLLEWNSNPYTEICNPFTQEKKNAFSFELKEGWLQKIIDQVEASKNNNTKNSV